MQKIRTSSHLQQLAALLVVDVLFFGFTDPAEIPSAGLIIGFLLFAVTLYQLVRGLFKIGAWYGFGFSKAQQRLARIMTAVIAAAVGLQSMGQLGGRDLLVLLPCALVAYMYVSYGSRPVAAVPIRE